MIKENLEYAKRYIDAAISKLDETPDKDAIADLLIALEGIDEYYKSFCESLDEDQGEEIGTSYEHGVNLEFYIESEWWHDVSIALRKLNEKAKEN